MAICYRRQGEYRPRVLPGINKLSPAQFQAAFYKWPVLRVPSVIVPREYNFVLLTEAKGFDATVEWVEPLDFDQRLFASSTPQ